MTEVDTGEIIVGEFHNHKTLRLVTGELRQLIVVGINILEKTLAVGSLVSEEIQILKSVVIEIDVGETSVISQINGADLVTVQIKIREAVGRRHIDCAQGSLRQTEGSEIFSLRNIQCHSSGILLIGNYHRHLRKCI